MHHNAYHYAGLGLLIIQCHAVWSSDMQTELQWAPLMVTCHDTDQPTLLQQQDWNMDASQNCHLASVFISHQSCVVHHMPLISWCLMIWLSCQWNDGSIHRKWDKLWHNSQILTHVAINSTLLELYNKGLISVISHSIWIITLEKYKHVKAKIYFIYPFAEVHWNCWKEIIIMTTCTKQYVYKTLGFINFNFLISIFYVALFNHHCKVISLPKYKQHDRQIKEHFP